jgi:GWxTD domain-containing protein
VFQQIVALAPGTYDVAVAANDVHSSRGFRTGDTLVVPAYGPLATRLSEPAIVYRSDGRTERDSPPDLILNPRHTAAYGGEAPRIYLEAYGAASPVPVLVQVLDEAGTEVWRAQTTLDRGGESVRFGTVDLPGGTLPLGKLWVQAQSLDAGGPAGPRAALVISISDQWMVANFDEVLEFLRYIARPGEIDSLRVGSPAERREQWEAFWAARDPLPASPINEFREQFFERVRFATEQFGEAGGLPGWRTDRGEVFIVLGPPDYAQDRYLGRNDIAGRPNGIEWLYENVPGGRLTLTFLDRTGFGRYELAPSSESAFRSVAERMKARAERGG